MVTGECEIARENHLITNYLISESEVVTEKSQTKAWLGKCGKAEVWDFPYNDRTVEVIMLFIIWLTNWRNEKFIQREVVSLRLAMSVSKFNSNFLAVLEINWHDLSQWACWNICTCDIRPEIVWVISKSNERAAWIWLKNTSVISDQNCAEQSSVTTLLHLFWNRKIKSLRCWICWSVQLLYWSRIELVCKVSKVYFTFLKINRLVCDSWINRLGESQSDCKDYQWFQNWFNRELNQHWFHTCVNLASL